MYTKKYKFRFVLVSLIFTLVLILIASRIIYIQVFLHDRLLDLAQGQHTVKIELQPRRGTVYDRNMHELAVNLRVDSVYAVARDVRDKRNTARILSKVLGRDENFIYERLNRDKLFVWIDRKISREKAQKVKKLHLKGIDLIDETKRFYPNAALAAHVIGFSGTDNIGLEGIESYYNKYMCGREGYKAITRDAKGREIQAFRNSYIPPMDGYDVVLTIDDVIQHIAEKALKKACKKHNAKAGVAIVMDPYNGDILAMAIEPSFNLNDFNQTSADTRRNRAIADYYEPGSVFKVVTASACLNDGVVACEDKFFCENGAWYVAGHTLHDHHGQGNLTFREVIEKSSNIGTVKAAMKIGESALYKYVKAYGFGANTGIGLPGEISGMVRPLNQWTKYSITAIPMGQEVGTTPIQLVTGISVVANGGRLVKPRIVSRIVDSKGQIIKEYKPVTVREVISENTSSQLKEILSGVVERGTGKSAKIKNFTVAGKTGTSQKIEPSGRYSHSKFVASFVGFAPAENPVISICVMVDEPHPAYFGGTVSAPVFKEIAQASLSYLDVEPKAKSAEIIVEAKVR